MLKKDKSLKLFEKAVLDYHGNNNNPGKISTAVATSLKTLDDLSYAYSPGAGIVCQKIVEDRENLYKYTNYGNRIAVITNGSAVLGLGDIGPFAAKPVMEGKAMLFKKFANLDAIDIMIDGKDPDKIIETIINIAPSFAGINLEDIKAPECFYIEKELQKRLDIPVFHDDQHGTAVVVGAALKNGLNFVNKDIGNIKIVISGAGAAALATYDFVVNMGAKPNNIFVVDSKGVLTKDRDYSNSPLKLKYALDTDKKTLSQVMDGADLFVGLSAPNILTKDDVAKMADKPLVFALSNPIPEIMPEDVLLAKPNAIIATGRSDYPNQVNNCLCFPYILKGALIARASLINNKMKIAAMDAIAKFAIKSDDAMVEDSKAPPRLVPNIFEPGLGEYVTNAVKMAACNK